MRACLDLNLGHDFVLRHFGHDPDEAITSRLSAGTRGREGCVRGHGRRREVHAVEVSLASSPSEAFARPVSAHAVCVGADTQPLAAWDARYFTMAKH